jgi:peroxiredoxin
VCPTSQIPPFVQQLDNFKSKGVDDVVVVSVNDHHVMSAWESSLGAGGKIKFYADPTGEFTRGVGQEIDLTAGGLGKRSQRYAFYADNGKVVHQMVEKSPGDLTESTADAMLAALKKKL